MPDREEHGADGEGAPGSAPVGIRAGQGDADDVRQPEGAEGPAVEVEPAELVDERREDGRHGHALEGGRRDEADEPDGQQPPLGRPGPLGHSRTAGPSRSGEPSLAS